MLIRLLAILLVVLSVSACASGGNEKVKDETISSVGTKVKKGVTTETQVKALYGEPTNVSLTDGGSEVWTYEYSHVSAKAVNFVPIVNFFAAGHDVDKNQVVFIFDKDKVMQNYTVHASQSEVHVGGDDVGAVGQ